MEVGGQQTLRVSAVYLVPHHPPLPIVFSAPSDIPSFHHSVNIGGWFVLEPFITPDLFQRYADAGAIDEWTISTLMAADSANGGLAQLERHYDTFIVRQPTLKLHVWHVLTGAPFVRPSSVHHTSHACSPSSPSKTLRRLRVLDLTGLGYRFHSGLSTYGKANPSCLARAGSTSSVPSSGRGSMVFELR